MSEFPFFRFFVGDYQADTDHLSTEEHGAYLLMLMHYWRKGFLKKEPSKLKNICKLSQFKFNKYFPTLLEFFEESEGFLINKRMEKELQHAGKKSEQARAAAKAKWSASADASALRPQMPAQCGDDAMSEVRGQINTPLPPQVGESEPEEKTPPNSRAHRTNPRAIAGKEKYEQQKQAEQERREREEAEDEEAEANKMTLAERKEAARKTKEALRKAADEDEVVL